MTPRVLNKRIHQPTPDSVYVGRPTKWGNPFVIGEDGDREEVIVMYESWIHSRDGQHLLADLHELRGKDLVCWCAPQACHADILLELANAETLEV